MPEALKAKLLNADGGASERDLPEDLFGGQINIPLMHQVVVAQLAAARSGTSSTKTRAEVRGGGKKPWRQKGTGRARHGSIRSPIWVGGGTVFGPKPKDHSVKVPKKMRKAALRSALASKAQDGCIWILDNWSETRTRAASDLLDREGIKGRTLVVLDPNEEQSHAVDRAFKNLGDAAFTLVGSLSTYDVLVADAIVFTSGAFESFTSPADRGEG